jgi:hypothetical protein
VSAPGEAGTLPAATPLRKVPWGWRLGLACQVILFCQAVIAGALFGGYAGELAEAAVSGAWLVMASVVGGVIAGATVEAVKQLGGR